VKIIIPTCDKYSHFIPGNIFCVRKFWPRCPYEIVVLTGKKEIPIEGIKVYYFGEDKHYATNLINFLDSEYSDEHLLLWLDDYYLNYVNEKIVAKAQELINSPEIDMIRLSAIFTPEGKQFIDDSRFCYIDKTAPYSFSQQASMWTTAIFRRFLKHGEDPWQTEIEGSTRVRIASKEIGEFLGVTQPVLNYRNISFQGNIDKGSFQWFMEQISPLLRTSEKLLG